MVFAAAGIGNGQVLKDEQGRAELIVLPEVLLHLFLFLIRGFLLLELREIRGDNTVF